MPIGHTRLIIFLFFLVTSQSLVADITPNFFTTPEQSFPLTPPPQITREKLHVRRDGGICADEIKHLNKRLPIIKKGLEKLLGYDVMSRYIPNISLIFSGGGYRAMIGTLGFLLGAQDIGLLDATWYMSALSGSTWALAGWIVQNLPLKIYRPILQEQVLTHLFATPFNVTALSQTFLQKVQCGQKVTAIDLWGAFIGNMLFRNLSPTGKDVLLSTFTKQFVAQTAPIPLFTSVAQAGNSYAWFEFTPFEAGCIDYNTFIPLSAFNSPFNNGIAREILPEQTLGYLLGICGSAFSINCKDAVHHLKNMITHPIILPVLEEMLNYFNVGNSRCVESKNFNFMLNLPGSAFSHNQELNLIDAGINFNLPIAPLLRRGVDMFIFCDMSAGLQNHQDFKDAIAYAQAHGAKLPHIHFDNIDKQNISFFIDSDDQSVPMVLYIPNMKEESTAKFQYSASEFNSLCLDMERRVNESKVIIAKAIEHKIKQLRNIRR